MRIISVEKKMADELCSLDSEMLLNKSGRPCLLMLRLKYKGRKVDFAVPFRSNIPPAEQKSNYFALPPRHTTRPKHRHGLHFSKMFPIRRQYLQKYHIDDNPAMLRAEQILKKNEKQIIMQAQTYLDNYSQGRRPIYATDIDLLLAFLDELDVQAA